MAQEDEASDGHREEALRLRAKVEALVQQARLLLHGDSAGRQPPAQRPMIAKRVERETELEKALEKTNWYQKEIKRLRRELEQSAVRSAGSGPGSVNGDPKERDPLELQNMLAEKKKELQRLRKSGDVLDKIHDAQVRAEAAQNRISPENQERLKIVKDEVEVNKRQNNKLFSERQKLVLARKKMDAEVRSAGSELRHKAAELKLPPRVPADGSGDMKMKSLQRDADILREAIRQDERKFHGAERAEDSELESVKANIQMLQDGIAEKEAEVSRLRTDLRELGIGPESTPKRGRPPGLPSAPEQRLEEVGAQAVGTPIAEEALVTPTEQSVACIASP